MKSSHLDWREKKLGEGWETWYKNVHAVHSRLMRLEPGQQVSEVARILVNYFDFVNLVRKPKKKKERETFIQWEKA